MTTKKIQGTTYGFVQVPEGAKDITFSEGSSHEDSGYLPSLHFDISCRPKLLLLPPGDWLLLGKADELNEHKLSTIMEPYMHGYKGYPKNEEVFIPKGFHIVHDHATESLHSLIQSLGMEFKLTVVLKLNEI